jgi:hypothetical protein
MNADELISAHVRCQIRFPGAHHPLIHLFEQQVTHFMAARVVDVLN